MGEIRYLPISTQTTHVSWGRPELTKRPSLSEAQPDGSNLSAMLPVGLWPPAASLRYVRRCICVDGLSYLSFRQSDFLTFADGVSILLGDLGS